MREHLNLLITAPAGIGKSWIACALAHSACRHAHSASYRRMPRLLSELAIARADGSYPKRLASLAKTEVLVIDDFGLAKLSAENRRDLLEIIEDRYGIRSTVATRELPVEKWHDAIGAPTLADAILDRLVHSAYQLNLKGESMRKRHRPLTQTGHRDSSSNSRVASLRPVITLTGIGDQFPTGIGDHFYRNAQTIYTSGEFQRRRAVKAGFLTRVLKGRHIVLMGSLDGA